MFQLTSASVLVLSVAPGKGPRLFGGSVGVTVAFRQSQAMQLESIDLQATENTSFGR